MNLEEEIPLFYQTFTGEKMVQLFRDFLPLFEMFDVEDETDWGTDLVGKDNEMTVRLIRAAYLISILAERHAGTLALIKAKHKNLYKRLETAANEPTIYDSLP